MTPVERIACALVRRAKVTGLLGDWLKNVADNQDFTENLLWQSLGAKKAAEQGRAVATHKLAIAIIDFRVNERFDENKLADGVLTHLTELDGARTITIKRLGFLARRGTGQCK